MKRQNLNSSNIISIGYDENLSVLEVEFKQGWVYQYENVPASVYNGLMQASSHGEFFDAYVKKGGYRFKRVG